MTLTYTSLLASLFCSDFIHLHWSFGVLTFAFLHHQKCEHANDQSFSIRSPYIHVTGVQELPTLTCSSKQKEIQKNSTETGRILDQSAKSSRHKKGTNTQEFKALQTYMDQDAYISPTKSSGLDEPRGRGSRKSSAAARPWKTSASSSRKFRKPPGLRSIHRSLRSRS